jgi:DNA-binding CsgD family transcriptional regulator
MGSESIGVTLAKGSPLIERGDELAMVEAALGQACGGSGSFVVIEGPAGMGKTAMLVGSRAAAEAHGMRVLRSRGAQLEREFAFGVVRQLFEPALAGTPAEEREELLDGAPRFAAQALGLPGAPATATGEPGNRGDWSFAVLHGLYWLCANLASCRPLCVVVDDAQWADVPSLRFLAFLLPRLEELPVALVVAARGVEGGGSSELLETIVGDSSAEVVRLQPLSPAGVRDFVEQALGVAPGPAFVDACIRTTRGTPFLLRELATALRTEGLEPADWSADEVDRVGAPAIGRSIALRLGRLPEPAVGLAHALAILERGELHEAANLAGLPTGEAEVAADVLVTGGIVEDGRPLAFVHPIVRAGIYESIPADTRTRNHRAAAQLLAGLPGENERVAEHLLAAEPAGEHWTVERLIEAARTASRTGAPESAAVYLRRALAEPPGRDGRPAVLLELGVAEAMVGLPSWRDHLEEAVETTPDDAARVDAAIVLALALSRAQLPADAVDVLCRTEASLDPADVERSVLLEALATGAEASNAVPVPETGGSPRRRRATRERADAEGCAVPEVFAVAAFIAMLANEPADVCAELVHRGLRAGRARLLAEPHRPWFAHATWFAWNAVSLLVTERYAEVRPLLDESITQARAAGDSSRMAAGLGLRGWLHLRLGDLAAAQTDTQTAVAASELRPPTLYRVLNGGVLVMALVDQGELDAAEKVLVPLRNEVESGSLAGAILRFSRGRLGVARSRVDEGLADFLAVGRLMTAAHATSPGYLHWRSEAALAYLLLGEPDEAKALADEEVELARAFGGQRALGIALRAAGIIGGGAAGEALLREAVASHEQAGVKLDQARSLVDLGALLRRANKRSEAREVLRRGLDSAHRLGARPLAERAETELRATGARPRRVVLTGLEALTASERRVAELAAKDLTNREIAQQLFVTARTVEGHLTSVFRKLRITSRDELSAALAGDAPSGA